MLIAKYNDEHKKDHRKCTTMRKLTQEQRQLIAFRYSTVSNKTVELKKFNLNTAVVLAAIRNDNHQFQPSTLQRLIRFANNDPLVEKSKASATKQKSVKTQIVAEATSRGEITPPRISKITHRRLLRKLLRTRLSLVKIILTICWSN